MDVLCAIERPTTQFGVNRRCRQDTGNCNDLSTRCAAHVIVVGAVATAEDLSMFIVVVLSR